jgi:transcriptional regulator with XRE-family HTH domain
MSKPLLGNVRARTPDRNQHQRQHQPDAKIRRPGMAVGKLLTPLRNRKSAAQYRPSRATRVLLARRLRNIREEKALSQSDIGRLTALRTTYISRVESAQHMPPLRILQRWARALRVPLYQFFYDGKIPLKQLRISELQAATDPTGNGTHERYFHELRRLLSGLSESNRKFLLEVAHIIHRRDFGARSLPLGRHPSAPRAIAR